MNIEGRRILISVTDKSDLVKFKALTDLGWQIISTGGTLHTLQNLGIPCTAVETVTGFPEMLNGRVKTLHPRIFAGILADRSKPEHMAKIKEHGIDPIDVVVVNLYDFVGKPSIEEIDIGGPSGLRAAAKNSDSVTVIVDPNDYDDVIAEIIKNGNTTRETRWKLALKVFEVTCNYDCDIFRWLQRMLADGKLPTASPLAGAH